MIVVAVTNWLPGTAALGIALLVGAGLALRARGNGAAPPDPARQLDALYGQIRDLDAGRHQMSRSDWHHERLRLEVEAARTLQSTDAPSPQVGNRRPSWGERNPRLSGGIWGAGIVAFLGLLGVSIQEFATDRPPMEQAGPPTTAEAPSAGALQALTAEAAAHPDDLDLQNRYARALMQAGQMMEAFKVTQATTTKDPENADARTYQGIVLVQIGDLAMAAKVLDKVIAGHPDHIEALGYRGLIYMQMGDGEMAAKTWERLLAADPAQAPQFQTLIQRARDPEALAEMIKATTAHSEGASDGPTAATAPTTAPQPPTGEPSGSDVSGTVELAAGLTVAPGQTLFIYARTQGQERGPPAAAKRLTTGTFPVSFRIGPGDSPMGGPFPENMTLTARVDADGNPTTHTPDDVEARVEDVKPGATGLTLTLRRAGP